MNPVRTLGNYRLVSQLAVGGMAEIYVAKTGGVAGFEKTLALKVIHPNYSEDDEFVQMLIDEAKLAVQLQHTNIVQTYDLGCVEHQYYIAMELIEGVDLYRLLRRASERDIDFPPEVVAFIGQEVSAGLDYAHKKKDAQGRPLEIVHRDVSPQNVLVGYGGHVKLVDFGIAKAGTAMRRRQTAAGVIKGKYYYMSPEQAWGEKVDARADVFSTGILLYEMLIGAMLYLDDDVELLLDKVRRANIQPPSTRRKGIPTELEAIVMKALKKRPEERWQSSGELGAALTRFLQKSPDMGATKLAGFVKHVMGPDARVDRRVEAPEMETTTDLEHRIIPSDSSITSEFEADENSLIFDRPLDPGLGEDTGRARVPKSDAPARKADQATSPVSLPEAMKLVGADGAGGKGAARGQKKGDYAEADATIVEPGMLGALLGGQGGGHDGGQDVDEEDLPTVEGAAATIAGGANPFNVPTDRAPPPDSFNEPTDRQTMPRSETGPTAPMPRPSGRSTRNLRAVGNGAAGDHPVFEDFDDPRAHPGFGDDDPEEDLDTTRQRPQATGPAPSAASQLKSTLEMRRKPKKPGAGAADDDVEFEPGPGAAAAASRPARPAPPVPSPLAKPAGPPAKVAPAPSAAKDAPNLARALDAVLSPPSGEVPLPGSPTVTTGSPGAPTLQAFAPLGAPVGPASSDEPTRLPPHRPPPPPSSNSLPGWPFHTPNSGTPVPPTGAGGAAPTLPPTAGAPTLPPVAGAPTGPLGEGSRRGLVIAAVAAVVVILGIAAALVFGGGSPSRGTIEVVSLPPGAEVRLDGKLLEGVTPLEILDVDPAQQHVVRVFLRGHDVWTQDVHFAKDQQRLRLQAVLTSQTATLEVDSVPQGAEVIVNGRVRGVTPLEVAGLSPTEELGLELRLAGYRSIARKVSFTGPGGETQRRLRVSIPLERVR